MSVSVRVLVLVAILEQVVLTMVEVRRARGEVVEEAAVAEGDSEGCLLLVLVLVLVLVGALPSGFFCCWLILLLLLLLRVSFSFSFSSPFSFSSLSLSSLPSSLSCHTS